MVIGFLRLTVVALMLAGGGLAPALAAERHALVVGNGAYQMTGWRLTNPPADAQLMADALADVGFTVETLIDADEDQLEDAIRRLRGRLAAAGEEAVGVFYYAGHAAQDDGKNLLIPVDVDAETMDDLWSQSARLGDVTRAFERAGNRANFIILDACRDVPLPSATRGGPRGLASAAKATGLLIAYATGPGQTASDGGGANSPYTASLAQLIREPGLPAEIMFKRVADAVEDATNRSQQPWIESGLRGADFCFAGCSAPDSTSPRATNRDAVDIAMAEAWAIAAVIDTTEEYQNFLAAYPEGPWSNEAANRIRSRGGSPGRPGAETQIDPDVFRPQAPRAEMLYRLRINQSGQLLRESTHWLDADGTVRSYPETIDGAWRVDDGALILSIMGFGGRNYQATLMWDPAQELWAGEGIGPEAAPITVTLTERKGITAQSLIGTWSLSYFGAHDGSSDRREVRERTIHLEADNVASLVGEERTELGSWRLENRYVVIGDAHGTARLGLRSDLTLQGRQVAPLPEDTDFSHILLRKRP